MKMTNYHFYIAVAHVLSAFTCKNILKATLWKKINYIPSTWFTFLFFICFVFSFFSCCFYTCLFWSLFCSTLLFFSACTLVSGLLFLLWGAVPSVSAAWLRLLLWHLLIYGSGERPATRGWHRVAMAAHLPHIHTLDHRFVTSCLYLWPPPLPCESIIITFWPLTLMLTLLWRLIRFQLNI